MDSYRWFALSFADMDVDICRLISRIDEDGEQWASCSQIDSTRFAGAYFKRVMLSVGRADPSGSVSNQVVETVISLNFTLLVKDNEFILRVSDNKRLAGSFISWLMRYAGFGFSAHPAEIVKLVGREVEYFAELDALKMVALKVSGVAVAHNIVGRMEFVSKYGMKIDEIKAIPKNDFTVSMVRYEMTRSGVTGIMAVHSTGRVSVSGMLAPWIIDYVEKNLLVR